MGDLAESIPDVKKRFVTTQYQGKIQMKKHDLEALYGHNILSGNLSAGLSFPLLVQQLVLYLHLHQSAKRKPKPMLESTTKGA